MLQLERNIYINDSKIYMYNIMTMVFTGLVMVLGSK